MFPVYAARPPAGIIAAQGFWFASAFKRVAAAFFDQAIDSGGNGAVFGLPVNKSLKPIWQEDNLHSASNAFNSSIVLTMPGAPDAHSAIARSSAALFAGLAVR